MCEAVEASCRGQGIADEGPKDGGPHHVNHRHVCGQLDVLQQQQQQAVNQVCEKKRALK